MTTKYKTLGTISPSISPKAFFNTYASKRQPVLINGLPDDKDFQASKWADSKLGYLTETAGNVTVMVEPIHPSSNQYGTDVERVPMLFKDFLSSLQSPDGPHHYLTTQYAFDEEDEQVGGDREEEITTLPPPANALTDDFPLVPKLLGNLSLQQVNLWLGKSKEGSSSGLHHDFHDNLYILLSGSKRFVLYPPSEHVHLYPHGKLDAFHSNGLISYKDAPVRSDGLPVRTAARLRVKAIEAKLEELDTLNGKGKGKEKMGKEKENERKKLMKMHDEALDELARVTLDAADEEDFGFGEGEEDDFDALMAGLEVPDGNGAGSSSSSKLAREEEDSDEEDEGEEEGPTLGEDDDEEEEEDAETSGEPSSFSCIPTYTLHTHLELPTTALPPPASLPSPYTNLKKTCQPYVVHLTAGQMLYLPASWWHEVTSTSTNDDGVHMAFNYWFYPSTGKTFEEPYEDALVWDYLKARERKKVEVDGKKTKRKRVEGESEGGNKRSKR
ncbi:Clavaminate synthase-like protein [Cristinia sonorae]|uniref:Clavaminate synthase-like protein n=1 Tax=Cristinia sonorae TaxID=1940300 RepID=A0A8K0XM88_9AGAR|nr:Clavaminate synthase-like protein [Cristinia sonorae]